MAKSFKTVVGFDALNRKLAEAVKRMPEASKRFLDAEAEILKGRAKKLTPVRTGHLRNNWKKTDADSSRVEVNNNVEYAGYVEYGRRKKGGGMTEGRYMLHKAMAETNEHFEEDAEALFEELLT